jgi:hypothetical protein
MNWRQRNLQAWKMLDPEIRRQAVAEVKKSISESDKVKIREKIAADPDNWLAEYHFLWGMQIRNALRLAGLTDDRLPPSVWPENRGDRNWDDYYGAIVEVAMKGGIWHDLTLAEQKEYE